MMQNEIHAELDRIDRAVRQLSRDDRFACAQVLAAAIAALEAGDDDMFCGCMTLLSAVADVVEAQSN